MQYPYSSDGPIRITREEAMSSEVDDFLSRQRSMIGEGGISKSKLRQVWYLQNWFLFGLAGALAAFAIWALTEPYFDDMLYIQGSIEDMDLSAPIPGRIEYGSFQYLEPNVFGRGWIDVRGQQIWLAYGVEKYQDGKAGILDDSELREGREVGVYLNYTPVGGSEGFAVAQYVVLSPPTPPPPKATLGLAQLNKRSILISFLLFPLVAGAIGLAIGAVEGLVCRLLRRALMAGVVGMLVGLLGGFIAYIPSEIVYGSLNALAMNQSSGEGGLSSMGFFIQMSGRGLSWCLAGMAMGLGQGVALRSKRLLLYGFLGGVVGGLLGGLLFDPIDLILLGVDKPSAHWSRMVGFTVIGLSIGTMIGVVQLLARNTWLRMTEGPLAGKEFLFFKDTMTIGASPQCEIYLFNDDHVLDRHATLRTMGDSCEIESLSKEKPVVLNTRPVRRSKLRHGDRITIGRTSFIFQKKQG